MYQSGKCDAALDAFDSVLKLDDTKKEYWLWRGITNFELRKWAEVIQDASEAIAFDSKYEDAYAYRGFSRFFLDDVAGALEDFEKVQCTQKNQSSLAWYRADANESFGHWDKAFRDYLLAYELDPSNVAAGIGLARLQACCPDASLRDGVKSIENAMSMCIRTDWKDWTAISVLAAAYAEAGDFASAIKQAQAAQELAPEEDKPERAARVEQYQHEIPFRLIASLEAVDSEAMSSARVCAEPFREE